MYLYLYKFEQITPFGGIQIFWLADTYAEKNSIKYIHFMNCCKFVNQQCLFVARYIFQVQMKKKNTCSET